MESLACVDVPALPLQVLVGREPAWRGEPVAVVDHDAPHGVVRWTNERARRAGVLAGLRYAAALSLCAHLRAATVEEPEVEAALERITTRLRDFTPEVESSRPEPGVFWANLAGLERLHATRIEWARKVRAALARLGFEAGIAVGSRRFSTYALAKALHGSRVLVFEQVEQEETLARRVSLARIGIEPRARDELARLGVRTVGEFVALPRESVLLRFGAELERLHALASGAASAPLEPERIVLAPRATLQLDFPVTSLEALLLLAGDLARPLLAGLAERGDAAREVALSLALENGRSFSERAQPSEPSLHWEAFERLLRLRLEHTRLERGAERIEVELASVRATQEQLRLFALHAGRDPRAAQAAFAALRAAFGEDAVVHASVRAAHLPEAQFVWEAGEVSREREKPSQSEKPSQREIPSQSNFFC
ncbi:MAG: DNA polymerase Y family protein, partial [Planctomycetota bacterium]|nr:DNA polymerase Y family protein [Planctomycetota bacterium]